MKMQSTIFLLSFVIFVVCQQDFRFPTEQQTETPNKTITEKKRIPIYIPGRCPENQLLYPGENKTDWICDCGPGFIYYEPKDGCFRAYRKGPCNDSEMLILPKKKTVPECIHNACKDGFAKYKEECYELDKNNGPCSRLDTFGVNVTTLEIGCLRGVEQLSIFNFPPHCPAGSKRTGSACKQSY